MKPHYIRDHGETEGTPQNARYFATVHPAKQKHVDYVLNQPTNDDGRSEWAWVRLPNGDLILGVFPHGNTYEVMEAAAQFPGEQS